MSMHKEIDPAQNCGDYAGFIPPDEYIKPKLSVFDPFQSCGDFNFGEIHPERVQAIAGQREAGNSVNAKRDTYKGATLVIGSAVAVGVVGGLALRQYRKNHK